MSPPRHSSKNHGSGGVDAAVRKLSFPDPESAALKSRLVFPRSGAYNPQVMNICALRCTLPTDRITLALLVSVPDHCMKTPNDD
jgi:hypothetical protein